MLIVKEYIISRINNGDAKAVEQLYTTFNVYLCAVATKYVYNSEAARESVNDDFMNGFKFPDVDKVLYGKHASNVMKTDVRETESGYEVDIDLPGFK